MLPDFLEERWPSMDLVSERLFAHLRAEHGPEVEAVCLRPAYRPRAQRVPLLGRRRLAWNVDRLLNRFWNYPRAIVPSRGGYDAFHVLDHSYAHLVHALPAERTVVTCHDLDAFRCLLERGERRRPLLRAAARRTLDGLRRAALITCDSVWTRDQLLGHGEIAPERLRVVPNGVDAAFSPQADREAEADLEGRLGPADPGAPELLHVGGTTARKRIDLLLEIVAAVRAHGRRVRLLQVGDLLTPEHERVAARLGVASAVVQLGFVDRRLLAALYRRAAMLLLTSEREGFGLPLLEAMRCGTPAVVTDLPPLRELGGDHVRYCPNGDAASWAEVALGILGGMGSALEEARRRRAMERAGRFTWEEYANRMLALYRELGRKAAAA